MSPLIIIYAVIFLIGVFTYFFNLYNLKAKKKLIGKIHSEWLSNFNLAIKVNWVSWIVVIVYLTWSIFLIIAEPHKDNDYTPLVLFIFFLSFYPRWKVIIGSKGIISGMKVFLWENLVEWNVIEKGKIKYLELKKASDSTPLKVETKRIRLPKNKEFTLPTF